MRALHPVAIEVRGLRTRSWPRRSGGAAALDGLDLRVPVGARLLLISRPEGAAPLLLRILAGTVRPAAGSIALAGVRRADESPSGWGRRVAYVGRRAAYDWLSATEALNLAARLMGLAPDERRSRVGELLERFRLASDATRPVRRAGAAVAQKVALAAALIGEPEVLLLDEPLRDVDPHERRSLLHLGAARTTIVLASRYPAGEEGLVNQVALIRHGRLALHAGVGKLAAASLPLSARGIEALADQAAGVTAATAR